jgi:hypothetical protein
MLLELRGPDGREIPRQRSVGDRAKLILTLLGQPSDVREKIALLSRDGSIFVFAEYE